MIHLLRLLAAGLVLPLALSFGTPAEAGFVTERAHLESSVRGALFDAGQVLLPGAPAATRSVSLVYRGRSAATSVGLYLDHYVARGDRSLPTCTASEPGDAFVVTITSAGTEVFQGSLANLARSHSSSTTRLGLPGSWRPGLEHVVTIAVGLPRSTENGFMGCSPTADFVWIAQ